MPYRPKIKKLFNFTKLLLLSSLIYVFVIVKLGTINRISSVEWDFYQSYTRSLIEDHDLNILNNISPSSAWIVSTTFNYPEMHDHGASVLWTPLVLLFNSFKIGTVIVSPELKFPPETVVYFILNWLLFTLAVYLLLHITKNIFSVRLSRWGVVFTFFGTGLFYYTLVEYGGTETTLFFYTILVLAYSSQIKADDKIMYYLYLGILFAFGRIIKIHFLTYLLPLAYFYLIQNTHQNKKLHFKRLAIFTVGFFLLIVPSEYNNFLKFGFLNIGNGYSIEFSFESFFKLGDNLITYFGPLGFFYATPLFFLTFILFIFGVIKWHKGIPITIIEKVGVLLYTSVFFKLLALQFVPTPGLCEFGNRNFIIDSAAHIFLVSAFLSDVKNKKGVKGTFIILFLLSCLWTLINYFWQNEVNTWQPDQRMAHYIWSFDIIHEQVYLHYIRLTDSFRFLVTNFSSNINLFFLCTFISFLFLNLKPLSTWILQKENISYVALLVFGIYFSASIANGLNNKRNSQILAKDKRFTGVSIGNGPHIFTYDNVATDLIPTMELDKFLGNREGFEYKKKWFLNFLDIAQEELVIDNNGFRQSLSRGRLPRIGVSDQADEHEVLSFDVPDRFRRRN